MCSSCANPGGLTGEAAVAEGRELQELLNDWVVSGIIKGGEVIWDPPEGQYWVRVIPYGDGAQEYTADQFRAYVQGLEAALAAARWQQ